MNNILSLLENNTCLVIPHQSPDGDCLGSSYTLSNYLSKKNIKHYIIMDDMIPTNYQFLKTDKMITSDVFLSYNEKIDFAIILDTSSIDRCGTTKEVLECCKQTIVIDHHKTNEYFGDYNIVKMVSSVGELLYELYQENHYEIDQTDAIGLYTSIVTDTGEFRYSNTESSTLRVVADIYDTKFDFGEINKMIYSNKPLKKVKLHSKIISEMTLHLSDRVAIAIASQSILEELNCHMFHTDGIVEALRDIEGVEIAILIKENLDDTVKASLRSKNYFDVSEIAMLYNGGGHARAAGCTIPEVLETAIGTLIAEIEARL